MQKLTFIFDDQKFEMEDTLNEYGVPDNAMGAANKHFDLPEVAPRKPPRIRAAARAAPSFLPERTRQGSGSRNDRDRPGAGFYRISRG